LVSSDELDELDELRWGICPHCGEPLPAGHGVFVVILRPRVRRAAAAA
jgi:hypothetical protein